MQLIDRRRRLAAEFIGTAALLATVVGSGIMGESLAGGNTAIALLAVSRGWRSGWTREQLVAVAIFGVTTVLMNVFFYLAIERIDLGKAITIEFIGPIAVAAATTRSRRNAIALLFAFAGVVVLGGVEVFRDLSLPGKDLWRASKLPTSLVWRTANETQTEVEHDSQCQTRCAEPLPSD